MIKPLLGALADSWAFRTGENGIYYEDLYHLVRPLHEVNRSPSGYP
jgi:hypothetical protein